MQVYIMTALYRLHSDIQYMTVYVEIFYGKWDHIHGAGIVEDAISWFLLFTGNGTKR